MLLAVCMAADTGIAGFPESGCFKTAQVLKASSGRRREVAAVCSWRAAELYGLRVLVV